MKTLAIIFCFLIAVSISTFAEKPKPSITITQAEWEKTLVASLGGEKVVRFLSLDAIGYLLHGAAAEMYLHVTEKLAAKFGNLHKYPDVGEPIKELSAEEDSKIQHSNLMAVILEDVGAGGVIKYGKLEDPRQAGVKELKAFNDANLKRFVRNQPEAFLASYENFLKAWKNLGFDKK